MKVDRLIVCLNNNPTYVGFWNAFSPVWLKKFKVKPTLVFVGSQDELDFCNLSTEYGDILRLDSIPEVIVNPSLDWSVTWALFWAASQYPEEICMLQGIDQMPLSNFFFDQIEEVDSEKYVIGFADAYEGYAPGALGYHSKDTKHFYPSSHHAAKGKLFKKIYNIDNSWESEVRKVFNAKNMFHLPPHLWGLDETYSSYLISKYCEQGNEDLFHKCRFFKDFWYHNRVDRIWHMKGSKLEYDKSKLKSGKYSEFHAPRPYHQHIAVINSLLKDLMEQ